MITVFGQVRFTPPSTCGVHHVSGAAGRAICHAAGVEKARRQGNADDGDKQVLVDFRDRSLSLDQATTASIRYSTGDRHLSFWPWSQGCQRLAPVPMIPLFEHTHLALDLDALLGGFRPLFQTLDPDKVNSIASDHHSCSKQGATINDIRPDRLRDGNAGRP